MELKTLFQTLLPVELQPPTHFPRRLLASLGYFRFRTWVAAHGDPVPDSHLYQPLYSPWEGEQAFEGIYRQLQSLTLVSRERCYMLWKTLQQSVHLQGDFVECGVFRGGTALLAAQTLQEHIREERRFHLFDSFEGMPKTTCGVDRFRSGDFSGTSVEAVGNLFAPYSFVKFHRGFIPDTFADLQIDQIAWAHIDVDIYQSVHDCIRYIYPRLVPGAFLIFDDYGFPSCAGARRAVDEAFATLPEAPLCLLTGQCLVVKLG
jgi:O-methyltransferase